MPTVVQDVTGDSTLQTAIAALKAKIESAEESEEISSLNEDITNIQTATSSDIGKALSPKTVSNGKVTEWQYKSVSGSGGGGGGGTSDYSDLDNKPSIGGVTLAGSMTLSDIGAASDSDLTQLGSTVDGISTSLATKAAASDLTAETTRATNAEALKIDKPSIDGTAGQVLQTDGNGGTSWGDITGPSDTQVSEAVSDWLDEHPEATTTVADGSINKAKLSSELQDTIDESQIVITTDATPNHAGLGTNSHSVTVQELSGYNFGNAKYANGRNLFDASAMDPISPKGVTITPLANNAFLLNGTATAVTIGTFNVIPKLTADVPVVGEKLKVFVYATQSIRLLVRVAKEGGTTTELCDRTVSTLNQLTELSFTKTVPETAIGMNVVFCSTSGTEFDDVVVWIGVYHADTTFTDLGSTLPLTFESNLDAFNTLYYPSVVTYSVSNKDYIDEKVNNVEIDLGSELTYVTPEWFYNNGEKIPSSVDAYSYIMQAIQYGITHNLPVFCGGDYKTGTMIEIHATGLNLFINSLMYTGSGDYAIRLTGRRNHIVINYIHAYTGGGGFAFYGISTDSGDYVSANFVRIMYAVCKNHCVAFIKANGATLVGGFCSYNEVHILRGYSQSGNIVYIQADSGALENNIYGAEVTTNENYAIWDEVGGNTYYNFCLETSAYCGIYLNCQNDHFINFRTIECENACDNNSGRTFIKLVGYSAGHEFHVKAPHGYSVDLSEHLFPPESYIPEARAGYRYGTYVATPLIKSEGKTITGRTTYYLDSDHKRFYNLVGRWAINWNGKVIHKLFKPSALDISSNVDMNYESEADVFRVSVNATITLSPSYCADGIDEISVIQSNGAVATIIDADGTTIFTGSQGDGTYRIQFVQEQVAFHPSTSYTMYTLFFGENNTAIITKVS